VLQATIDPLPWPMQGTSHSDAKAIRTLNKEHDPLPPSLCYRLDENLKNQKRVALFPARAYCPFNFVKSNCFKNPAAVVQ
jgi:hypothetical protein